MTYLCTTAKDLHLRRSISLCSHEELSALQAKYGTNHDILVVLVNTLWCDLQFVFHAEDILTFTRFFLSLSKLSDERWRGNNPTKAFCSLWAKDMTPS